LGTDSAADFRPEAREFVALAQTRSRFFDAHSDGAHAASMPARVNGDVTVGGIASRVGW
jgi:hypothetical protein